MKEVHVGLLVDEISNLFSQLICNGAYKACQETGAKLSLFFGGFYENTYQKFGYQKNMIYPLADTKDLDFLIVSISSICRESANKQKLLSYFKDVPIVTLNQSFEGISSVLIDNETGLKEALEYIITNCENHSFAMVAGPVSNNGSNIRKRVFVQTLKKYGLENEIYVEHAPLMERSSVESIRTVFKKKPQTDVLICVNDELAISAYTVCAELGKTVGKDVLILGFDDIHEASCLQPGLSSIKSPIEDLGYEAVLKGMESLSTKTASHKVLPTKFVLRNSLGNHDFLESPLLKEMESLFQEEINFEQFWQQVVLYLQEDILSLKRIMEIIYHSDMKDASNLLRSNSEMVDFFGLGHDFMKVDVMMFVELIENFSHFAILHTNFETEDQSYNAHRHVEKMLHQVASQLNSNLVQLENIRYIETLQINTLARKVMMFENEAECHRNILSSLKELDIQNAQIYLFDHEPECLSFNALPNKIRLSGEIVEGQEKIYQDGDMVSLNRIISKTEKWQSNRPISILSIYSNTKLFGYILCDVSLERYAQMEFLSIHIATSLHTLSLMKDLKNQSRKDVLTGLYNRRGFEEKVGGYFRRNKQSGNGDFYILLADIDELKKINDNYGHKVGDIAIRKGADILRQAFGTNGFLVRLGGDEFLAIVKMAKEEAIVESLERAQKQINQEIPLDKDTNFSYGMKRIDDVERMNLDDLLKEVDILMYKHKKTKKKG
ncbi:MAG: GGDEF domain-containing protein [Firmicutes bacterium]|nr:GGDEF domain-containing protein [Bacillota bacterium]